MTTTPFQGRPVKKDPGTAETCNAMGDILNRIGDKWSVMIVGYLKRKTMRFNELRHAIGSHPWRRRGGPAGRTPLRRRRPLDAGGDAQLAAR